MKKRSIFTIVLMFGLTIFTMHTSAATLILTSGGAPTVTGTMAGTAASTSTALGSTLTATLVFGDVSLRNTNPRITIVMPIRISTNAAYKISVQRTVISATSGVQATDIGFGVGNFRAQQPGSIRLTANAVSGMLATSPFGANPTLATNNTDGQPQFLSTLNNVSTAIATQVFTGVTTVASGTVGRNSNSVLADLTFVIVPQYFTPTASFTVTLTITIS